MIVQSEAPDLYQAIRDVHLSAFPTADEADIADRLRSDRDAVISLVAMEHEATVGHVVFSRMTAPMRALGLGPVAVRPEWQGRGIASRLIEEGIDRAREAGWEAVFVLGDPAFYGRFGFTASAAAGFETPYAGPHFQALSLAGNAFPTCGRVDYAPAFGGR